jgi:hypothetical protein
MITRREIPIIDTLFTRERKFTWSISDFLIHIRVKRQVVKTIQILIVNEALYSPKSAELVPFDPIPLFQRTVDVVSLANVYYAQRYITLTNLPF